MIGIRKTGRVSALVISLMLVFMQGHPLFAQETAITDGVAWLEANQDASGLWGVDKQTPYRDATVVLESIGLLSTNTAVIGSGLDAIWPVSTVSTDYLARKVLALVAVGSPEMSAGHAEALAAMQSASGGWGYNEGYTANNLETALALRALKNTGYSDLVVLGAGVGFLTASQNTDGGWSFVESDSSCVFFTAHVINTLDVLQSDFMVGDLINGAATWLKTQAHGDGGFGTRDISNTFETSLALTALILADPSATEIAGAQSYLESTQLPNGSWADDAYNTAMAITGLNWVSPDLAVYEADIVLSNPTPSDFEIVTISVTVANDGIQSVNDILVQVFDGHPDWGGVQIGSDITIGTLASLADTTIQVDWNTELLAGDHNICAFVDPLVTIREPRKLNNDAERAVHVFFPPDLVVAYDGISFTPFEADIDDDVTIVAEVWNTGELPASNVSISFWVGDPDDGGSLLHQDVLTSVPVGSSATFDLGTGTYFSGVEGNHEIYVCVDRANSIREISEYNNCNVEILWIGPRPHPMTVASGLNLLGLPSAPSATPTSYSILPEIPSCNELNGWDRATQMWVSAVDIGGGMIIGDEFDVNMRDGFFARTTELSTAPFIGRGVHTHDCTTLEEGLNIVSIPEDEACYTGYSLIEDIPTCSESHTWDANLQMWVSAVQIAPGVIIGEDFSVTPGNGYFVRVGTGGDWCSQECDTITTPAMPDLLVTPADIYLDPNPGTVGSPVVIAMNVTNIGTDSAFLPQIEMYLGDPGAGGTFLFGGQIADTLLPGEASGLYGNSFTFGSGFSADIYAIADYADVMTELDESNNQATQSLVIISPSIVTEKDALPEVRTSGAFVHLPELEPSGWTGEAYTPRQIEHPEVIGTATDAARETVRITDVVVGNHSGQSVTIAWRTDSPSSGHVLYGSSESLGMIASESGPDKRQHIVVLDYLTESTLYYFDVASSGAIDNNRGRHFSFSTAANAAGVPFVIYGRATNGFSSGSSTLFGQLDREGVSSYPLMSQTDSHGRWMLNLGNLKDSNSGSVMHCIAGDTFLVTCWSPDGTIVHHTIDISATSPQDCSSFVLCSLERCGDIDGSGRIDQNDLVILGQHLFPEDSKECVVDLAMGDIDCSGRVDLADLMYMADYLFGDGLAPCDRRNEE